MAQDPFTVTITHQTLRKLVDNILIDSLPNKKAMSDFLSRLISKGYHGNDFFMALTDTFPKIKFKSGDTVRIRTKSLYYGIDYKASEEQGYIEGDGIYVDIIYVDPYASMCYNGKVRFIDNSGELSVREFDFNNDNILMDNTIRLSAPDLLPGDLI